MNKNVNVDNNRYISKLGVWALGFGCSVGWGAFVMPGTTFLPIAGPLGTFIGMIIGAIIMMVIGINYYYMMNRYSDNGGAFSYTKKIFGHDHAFVNSWFLVITYVSIIWANATALPLITNYLFDDVLKFGFHYTIAGFDVYLGELLLSLSSIIILGLITMKGKKVTIWLQVIFSLILIIGIIAGFIIVTIHNKGNIFVKPNFSSGANPLIQIFSIIALVPWAFIGFESVSHSVENYKFNPKKMLAIFAVMVVTIFFAYTLVNQTAVAIFPDGFSDWKDYIDNKNTLSGMQAVPAFNAVNTSLGKISIVVIGLTVLSAIATGIIGNYLAASKLMTAMANEGILSSKIGKTKNGVSSTAILVIMIISLIIPFFGRTAIGWIVDITTIGAIIAYGYTSACCIKSAKEEKNKKIFISGIIGLTLSLLFSIYLLLPLTVGNYSGLANESYIILVVWSIIGIGYFRFLFTKDKERKLGKSPVVWIAMLFIIFATSLIWVRQTANKLTIETTEDIQNYNKEITNNYSIEITDEIKEQMDNYVTVRMNNYNNRLLINSITQAILSAISIGVLISIYAFIQKREKEMEAEKYRAEQSSIAKSFFLSNMSHDIRTPMNAIINYTNIALQNKEIPDEVREYLEKVASSGEHLLDLINDILDMSRIENGKMESIMEPHDIINTLDDVRTMFETQMAHKNLEYHVECDVTNKYAIFDRKQLNRILLNLISNAYKYTPEGGKVEVILKQIDTIDNHALYQIKVKDNGIGMSEEFVKNLFGLFERERDKTVENIQGTGLGMFITKSFVELLGGTIEVESKKGLGSTFTVNFNFEIAKEEKDDEQHHKTHLDYTGMRALLVDDNEINREIATLILSQHGFIIDEAVDGQDAVQKVKDNDYEIIFMDVMMPIMNGYEATIAIRNLDDEVKKNLPVIAMTANAFTDDIEDAKKAGMTAHTAKPIDIEALLDILDEIFKDK